MPATNPPTWRPMYGGGDYECIQDYDGDGLCPILLGDVVGGIDIQANTQRSFEIFNKLGHGTYSTVWLAKDVISYQFMVLKILRSEHSTSNNTERQILQKLGKLRTSFFYNHPKTSRSYLCLGMDPVGATLHQKQQQFELDYLNTVPSIIAFVKALVSQVLTLHEQGITHGDLSYNNVAFGVHYNALSPEALARTYNCERLVDVHLAGAEVQPPLPPNYPKYIVYHNAPLMTDIEDMSRLKIIDFESASFDTSKAEGYGTRYFGAPELSNRDHVSPESDLWSLGCVILCALAEQQLFHRSFSASDFVDCDQESQRRAIEEHLAQNYCVYSHPELGVLVADIVQCLLQGEPSQRDPTKVRELLRRFETGDFPEWCGKESSEPYHASV